MAGPRKKTLKTILGIAKEDTALNRGKNRKKNYNMEKAVTVRTTLWKVMNQKKTMIS